MNTQEQAIKAFEFEGKHTIRTIAIDGEPWFVASDVCTALDHSNTSKAISRLDDDEKGINISYTLGGNQEVLIINESGLYSLILTSRKPEAKKFKKWVTAEVLPSIRKTGRYQRPSTTPRITIAASREISRLAHLVSMPKTSPLQRQADALLLQELVDQHGLPLDVQSHLANIQQHNLATQDADALNDRFFTVFHTLIEKCRLVNHSKREDQIAVNLIEVYQLAEQYRLVLPPRSDLVVALQQHPDLIRSNKSIQSAHTRRTLKCWLFRNKVPTPTTH